MAKKKPELWVLRDAGGLYYGRYYVIGREPSKRLIARAKAGSIYEDYFRSVLIESAHCAKDFERLTGIVLAPGDFARLRVSIGTVYEYR